MTILLTGGTGFLGLHLATRLLELGYQVKIMGRDFKNAQSLLSRGAIQVIADLRDEAAVISACQNCEVVIHAGAFSSPWGKLQDFEDINVGGTQAVLRGCKIHHLKRLIHISTPAVIFDGCDQINVPDTAPYASRHLSHYSFTKQKAEALVLSKKAELETIILRPKAIYGPGDTALLPRLIRIAKTGRLPQMGDGKNLVALTYVSDVVDAIVCALEKPIQSDFPVYTITGPENAVLWDVIKQVLEHFNVSINLYQMPEWLALKMANILEAWGVFTGREPPLTRYTVALLARHQTYDISRAINDLGYSPKVPISQGLKATLKSWEV
jgi:2-alkyl-3-oxoalkanoate reductase